MTHKRYSTERGVKDAIKRQGLHLMNWELKPIHNGVTARFFVHDDEDRREIISRGFDAIVDPERAAP